MAESALRQYEYGGDGLFGAFMPSRKEVISPEQRLDQGYTSTRRGPGVDYIPVPAKYGEPESGFEYAPIVRGIKSALNYIGDAFSDPQQAIESVQTVAPQALGGLNQYMKDQYTAGALGGTAYNPQTGQVTEFNPIDAATMLAPSGFLTRAAATPGSVVLGMIGSKNTKYTPEQLEAIKQLNARGWDTEKLFLHGTASDYDDAFRASQTGDLGPGFYTTGQVFDDAGEISTVMSRSGKMETVPDIASRYANIRKFMRPEQRGSGAPNTRPVVYKKDLNFLDVQGGMVGPVDAERVNALKAQGYDGIRVIDPNTGNAVQTNVFDPDNVRSAFDYSIPDTPAQGQSALRNLTDTPVTNPSALRSLLDAPAQGQSAIPEQPRIQTNLGGDQSPLQGLGSIIDPNTGRPFDDRYAVGVSGGNPRANVLPKLDAFSRQVEGSQANAPEVSLVDYLGRPYMTHMSDRTDAQTILRGINGIEFREPIGLQGGQDFMFNDYGLAWAGGGGHPTSYMRVADQLRKDTGENPLWLPWRMAPKGSDFSGMTGEVMMEYSATNMSPGQKRTLNSQLKEVIPGFTNVDDMAMRELWIRLDTATRKKGLAVMDKMRDAGGISVSEARLAIADPRQTNAPDWGLQNVGEINASGVLMPSQHRTYPKGIPGGGLGVLKKRNQFNALDLVDDQLQARGKDYMSLIKGKPTSQSNALMYGNVMSGIITEDLLKRLGL